MSETPPIPEQKPQILSLEEFARRSPIPRYNNFFLYFTRGAGEIYRQAEHYKRFAEEHADMAASLCDKIQNQRDSNKFTSESLKPFDADLYEAYKIMCGYGVSDRDLFS